MPTPRNRTKRHSRPAGVYKTGGVITSAGIIMFIAIGGLMLSGHGTPGAGGKDPSHLIFFRGGVWTRSFWNWCLSKKKLIQPIVEFLSRSSSSYIAKAYGPVQGFEPTPVTPVCSFGKPQSIKQFTFSWSSFNYKVLRDFLGCEKSDLVKIPPFWGLWVPCRLRAVLERVRASAVVLRPHRHLRYSLRLRSRATIHNSFGGLLKVKKTQGMLDSSSNLLKIPEIGSPLNKIFMSICCWKCCLPNLIESKINSEKMPCSHFSLGRLLPGQSVLIIRRKLMFNIWRTDFVVFWFCVYHVIKKIQLIDSLLICMGIFYLSKVTMFPGSMLKMHSIQHYVIIMIGWRFVCRVNPNVVSDLNLVWAE